MKNIKTFEQFVNEVTDYRNVTGYGTMGLASNQNAGPSYNVGPLSATYRQPTILSTTTDTISDQYFNGAKLDKMRKIRKNPRIVKLRKKKSKDFNDLDKVEIKSKIKKT